MPCNQNGWASIHRSIFDNWVWQDKPFSKGQAWIDLILKANHSQGKALIGKELVNVERGSFITSEVKLAERWGWSRHKVRDFLDLLIKDKMLDRFSDSKKTTIKVLNYDAYQSLSLEKGQQSGQVFGQQKDSAGTAKEQQRDTNNNVNNNNILLSQPEGSDEPKKPKGIKKRIYEHDSIPYKIALAFEQLLNKNVPNRTPTKESSLQTWADSARMMLEADKYSKDEIWRVMKWAKNDDFWRPNVMSVPKLRKHFERLRIEIAKPQKQGAAPGAQESEVDYNKLLYDRG